MAYENPVQCLSFKAAEDMRNHQFRFVHLESDTLVALLDSGTEMPLGILQNRPNTGEIAVVMIAGVSKLVAGSGGLARDDYVTPEYVSATDNGKGLKTTTNADKVRAICIQAAGSEDDLATVRLVDMIYTSLTS